MSGSGEIWRFNVDTTWQYFCSMKYELFRVKASGNSFMRYHHACSGIFYAVSTIESFLNQEMRAHMKHSGEGEEKIFQLLRRTRLDTKRADWPTIICGKEVKFSADIDRIFEVNRNVRNEVIHPKRRDHSIYSELDQANLDELAESIAIALVMIYEGKSRPFPYWVLGWNYVGMNGDAAHPFLSNNMNGFVYSLRGMGFDVPTSDLSWERKFMTSLVGYGALKDALDRYPHDIEPYWPDYPTRPRLTRRWWDGDFIYRDVELQRKRAV